MQCQSICQKEYQNIYFQVICQKLCQISVSGWGSLEMNFRNTHASSHLLQRTTAGKPSGIDSFHMVLEGPVVGGKKQLLNVYYRLLRLLNMH